MAALDRTAPLPLWAQLLQELTRRLDTGELAGQMPTEAELVAEYDVSRHTVREALRRLRDSGRLQATRGRGTYATEGIHQPLGALYSLFREVEARGMAQTSIVRALDVRRDAAVAARLHLAPGADLVHLERVRLVDGEPLAVDHAWLPAELARPLLDADFTRTGLYDELARRCGVRPEGGREQLRAEPADPLVRDLLALPAGAAVMTLERTACAGGRPVEWRVTQVRADRFSVSVESASPALGRPPGLSLASSLREP